MAGNRDFLNILREVRGTGAPGTTPKDGIWYELTIADKNGNPGIYGDILAKYGVIVENSPTLEQAVAILENLNVEVTTLPAGSQATSELVNGVWQIGLPRGANGIDGNDGSTPEVAMAYDSGNLNYTVTVDGTVITNTNLLNLDTLVDSKVSTNVSVQETLEAKQDVLDAVATAQGISDSFDATVVTKKQEIATYTNTKIDEIGVQTDLEKTELSTYATAKVGEYNDNALSKLNQYNNNHTDKINAYNNNDSIKMDQYNENHIERLSEINYAYADRIVELIKTRNFMGILDEYVPETATHMITFLDTTDANYIYYGNGTLLTENVDYTVYDSTTIELTVKANPYDVIVQVNTQVLNDMLTAEGTLFEDRIGAANGIAGLDNSGKVPAEQLPSYVDDVLEVATYADLPVSGEMGKIYVVVADETRGGNTSSYRWTGSLYAMVNNTLNAADVKALYEANANTNVFTDAEKLLVDAATILATTATTLPTAINEVHNELDTVEGRVTALEAETTDLSVANRTANTLDVTSSDGTDATLPEATATEAGLLTAVDKVKLDAIEANAKDDQLASEVPAEAGTNTYAVGEDVQTQIDQLDTELVSQDGRLNTTEAKLATVEEGATADQTAEEIKTAYESNLDTNAFTDALKTLLEAKKVKNVTTDALNNMLVITYTDDTVANLNINDIVTDVHVSGATLDVTTNVLTLTNTDGGADVTVDLSDFVNSSELTNVLSNHYTKNESNTNFEPKNANIQSHISSTANPHGVTKAQVGLGNVDNTADSTKVVASAGKWTTARTITLGGDLSGSTTFDGSGNLTLSAQVADDSHNHTINNIDGLQAALDAIGTVAEFEAALN